MLKVTNDKKQSSEIYITPVEGSKFIPLNLGGRLTNTANSVNDLGKYLLRASADGDVNEIRELLSEGAPFTSDWLGTSPLHLASKNNHVEVCEILLRAGISCNARTKVDRTPLHIAAYEGHLDIIRLLLAENAEINCTDLLEMTPLHWAVQQGNVDAVQALLKYGADKQSSNKFDLKPIDIAKQIDRSDIIMILEEEEQEDPLTATENLKIEMAAQDEENLKESTHNENYSTNNIEYKQEHQNYEENSISMKILQEHGITMLPNDDEDNNLLSSVMETGHSVVLTDVGKQVLDSVKASEEYNEDITRNLGKKNFITVTANEFLALAANATINKNRAQIFRQVDGKLVPKTIKKIVMKKNKIQTISQSTNVTTKKKIYDHQSGVNKDAEVVKIAKRLAETKRTIDELKKKIIQKEAEAEIYRQQLNNLMEQS